MWSIVRKIIAIIMVVLIVAYTILSIHAAANWHEEPKGPPAYMEWQGEGKTIL